MGMEPTIVLIIAIALAAIVIGGALFYAMQKRRTTELRSRFGPEYERALKGQGDRRAAERELGAREQAARALKLRPLDVTERDGFAQSWAATQRRFVDDPLGAVDEAHQLLAEVMQRRGYPTGRFDEEVSLLSVHHPRSVQHYRAANDLAERGGGADGDTEEQRQALIHYRALFEDLLESDEGEDARTTGRFTGPKPTEQAPTASAR